MNSGDLNSRITILHFEEVMDPIYGPQPGGWVRLVNTWASIKNLSGMTAVRMGLPVSEVKSSIRVRYRDYIDTSMMIEHRGTYYQIDAILPHDNIYLDLLCTTTEHP